MIIFTGNNRYQIIPVSVIIDSFAFKYKYVASIKFKIHWHGSNTIITISLIISQYLSFFTNIFVKFLFIIISVKRFTVTADNIFHFDVEHVSFNTIVYAWFLSDAKDGLDSDAAGDRQSGMDWVSSFTECHVARIAEQFICSAVLFFVYKCSAMLFL